jgi:hypothetical protein
MRDKVQRRERGDVRKGREKGEKEWVIEEREEKL